MSAVPKSQNILFFMCLEDRGGAEISMIRLAQGLIATGHTVTFAVHSLTNVSAGSLAKELGFTGTVIDFGSRRSLAVFLPLFNRLRTEKYDTVISALTHTNLVAITAARLVQLFTKQPMRVIVTEHGIEGIEACTASRFFSILTRLLYVRADTVVAVSRALAESWRKLLPDHASVKTIYNPVMEGDRDPRHTYSPAHQWLVHKTMPVIMGIGRLRPEKNFALLIRAFALMTRSKKARLIILGEGDDRPMLEALIRELGLGESVLMPGFVPLPQAWLAYADLFVCPSKQEGFGNVIVEALACGVPVVSTDCPFGPAEILQQGFYGTLVPVDDMTAMALAMEDGLRAPVDTPALIARAQDFSVSRCIDAYAALIDNEQYPREASEIHTFLPNRFQALQRWLRSVFFYEHWMVGVVDQPIRNALTWNAAPPVRWIAPRDMKRYYADPFPWPGSDDTLLCEEYDIQNNLGRISVLKLDANGVAVGIDAKFPIAGHLSFPFIFMHRGVVYVMPESSGARRLEILRWQEHTGTWINHAVIFDNLPVADAALFEKDGLFWISYTDVSVDPHDNLHLVYAPTLAGPWIQHPANPVMCGRENSRNGGSVFEVDGKLYRPAQDCSNLYGGALRIMEITEWTTTSYAEREVTHILPSSPLYPDGFHSLVAWGDKCLVDGMRLTFSAQLVWNKIKRRLFGFSRGA